MTITTIKDLRWTGRLNEKMEKKKDIDGIQRVIF
jgi:hypothetical protein